MVKPRIIARNPAFTGFFVKLFGFGFVLWAMYLMVYGLADFFVFLFFDGEWLAIAFIVPFTWMFLVLLEFFAGFWRVSDRLVLFNDRLYGVATFKGYGPIDVRDVRVVKKLPALGTYIRIADSKKHLQFSNMEHCGEIIEYILSNAALIEQVNLKRISKMAEFWKKEPDWDIINAAIARAEENRKKKEQGEKS